MTELWNDSSTISFISAGSQVFSLRYWIDQANVQWSDYLITFYVVVLFIFFIIINFMYASFSVQNQGHQFSFTWPLTLLQYICLLIVTVLFQPILELMISMLSCQTMTKITTLASESSKVSASISGPDNTPVITVKELIVMTMFNDVTCFQGTHVLHSCLAIVVSIVLIALTLLIVFLYFESRKQPQIILSK